VTRALAAVAAAAALVGGCLMPRYLAQAAHGQLDLLARARPLDEVIADPSVPLRTRVLLAEVDGLKAFATRMGLTPGKAYRKYVVVPYSGTVWFVGAAPPLSFEPRKWCFPIAGCFTGLGWFDEQEALRHRDELRRAGWDAMARPAGAYSTGGWFPDPITSSMLSNDDTTAYADLANVVLHESVHATVFIPDQMFFNEGLAEYVGDVMTDLWLIERFGKDSAELTAWKADQAKRRQRMERTLVTYDDLAKLYASDRTPADKLAAKAKIIDKLVEDLALWERPNNANLVELRLYKASYDGFARVHAACGDIRRLVASARRLKASDFTKSLEEDLSRVLARIQAGCQAAR
jgi:predicted aminopeptidase